MEILSMGTTALPWEDVRTQRIRREIKYFEEVFGELNTGGSPPMAAQRYLVLVIGQNLCTEEVADLDRSPIRKLLAPRTKRGEKVTHATIQEAVGLLAALPEVPASLEEAALVGLASRFFPPPHRQKTENLKEIVPYLWCGKRKIFASAQRALLKIPPRFTRKDPIFHSQWDGYTRFLLRVVREE